MGLSRLPKEDKGSITTFQLLLGIAEGLEALISDPKALHKAVELSYGLDDEGRKKAETALADIANAEAQKREALKQQGIATEMMQAAETAAEKSRIEVEAIKAERKRLADVDKAQGAKALELQNKENDLSNREGQLAAGKADLEAQLKALKDKQAELNAYDQSLKDKAAQLRSIVGA